MGKRGRPKKERPEDWEDRTVWTIRGVDDATKTLVKLYATSYHMTLAEAIKSLVVAALNAQDINFFISDPQDEEGITKEGITEAAKLIRTRQSFMVFPHSLLQAQEELAEMRQRTGRQELTRAEELEALRASARRYWREHDEYGGMEGLRAAAAAQAAAHKQAATEQATQAEGGEAPQEEQEAGQQPREDAGRSAPMPEE